MSSTVTERLIWFANWAVPKRSGSVLLYSLPTLEDGTLAIGEALLARKRPFTVLAADKAALKELKAKWPASVKVLRKRSIQGAWAFLRAATTFTTHGLYGALK